MLRFSKVVVLVTALALVLFSAVQPPVACAQATVSTGNLAGIITDPTGAVVPGAKVTIINTGTGQTQNFTSTGAGTFNSGGLIPGDYTVRVEAKGFKTTALTTFVQVGTTTPANIKLEVGTTSQVIEVASSAVTVNTEQSSVQGVLSSTQIDNLPINGRNFLDIAQLEPGVQIQDGSNFDPTKGGFTGISVGGRAGRSTRIALDGLDITDETVGTSMTNISAGAIQEFQIAQSGLDLSTEITSGGAVNVTSRSGSNTWHGEGFYLFRDDKISANFNGGVNAPYQRNHFGGRIGGPVIKDHFFLFANVERVKQDESSPVSNPRASTTALSAFDGTGGTPFREVTSLLRADVKLNNGASLFYRLTYDNADGTADFGVFSYDVFTNTNNTPAHAFGADFSHGNFSHSFRFGFTAFHNSIGDAQGRHPDLISGALVRSNNLRIGPNVNAPQATFQRNTQVKYDGSWIHGVHTIRYGAGFNRIRGGGFASFFGNGPRITTADTAAARAFANDSCDPGLVATGGFFGGVATTPFDPTDPTTAQPCFPGGKDNLLNFPVSGSAGVRAAIALGNGQGFFTELPAFGLPAGGQFDNRVEWYVGDTWKFRSNLTFNFGVRYVRDSGRTNSDLPPVPCSDLDVTAFNPVPVCPASGRLLDILGPGFGASVRQDNNNFGGNLGVVWDPWKKGRTIIRAGIGLNYENAIFNNVLFGRPGLLRAGLFNAVPILCTQNGVTGTANTVPFPGGPVAVTPGGANIQNDICGQALGRVAGTGGFALGVGDQIVALQKAYQAATAAAGPAANALFPGHNLAPDNAGVGFFDPNYRSPYSIQMNAGVQHELWKGAVLSADYVRNVNLHYLLGIDTNHVGDARFLNKTAAQNAIAATLAAGGFADINAAILGGATIGDFAANGLASGVELLGSAPINLIGNSFVPAGTTPDFGAAFPGINPFAGGNTASSPVGRSVYSALQVALRAKMRDNPLPLLKRIDLQAAYTLSRFSTQSGDQEFLAASADNANPGRFFGPAVFDRRHQLSVGAIFDFKKGPLLSLISHIRSPLPTTLSIPTVGDGAEIFHTDLTGDGTSGDIIGNIGQYQREISPGGLNSFITKFNSTVAGTITPAGQALVDAGLFTEAQLIALGATVPTIDLAPPGQVGNDWLTQFDLKFSYRIKVGEKFTVEPNAAIYNLFNFANYNTFPDQRVSGLLDGGGVNGDNTTPGVRDQFRAIQTTSLYGLGAARQAEIGLRIVW